MKDVRAVLELSTHYLADLKIENPKRQVEELLSHVLKLSRLELYCNMDRPLTEEELEKCRLSLKRRGKGEPLAYILGQVPFYHCEIEVSPSVLIPRQETEILVDKIVNFLKGKPLEGKVLWDICCGSGCIGIALKKAFPELVVVASDLSASALELAKKNSSLNQTTISFLHGDLLEPFKGQKADFVVCNPPYISDQEYKTLDREVALFEPKTALVAEENGLSFYKRIANELPAHLNPNATVWLEIGTTQGPTVFSLFSSPAWINTELQKDWASHDRILKAQYTAV